MSTFDANTICAAIKAVNDLDLPNEEVTSAVDFHWTPLIVLGALAMVTSGEWWEVPGAGPNAATFAFRCRKIGLDATSSYGRVFVRRPDEPREALTQSGTEVVRTDRFVGGQS